MPDEQVLSLAGQTLRFTFADGPTANKTYEHTFNRDGTVNWREVGGSPKAQADGNAPNKNSADGEKDKSGAAGGAKKPAPPTRYESFEVAPGSHLVSYLSAESGYTLTVMVNTKDGRLHGFASSSKEWYPLTGKLQAT